MGTPQPDKGNRMYDVDLSLPLHPSVVHPLTGERLRAVGLVGDKPVWPILGSGPENDPPKQDDPPKEDPPKEDPPKEDTPEDLGFPKETPVTEMSEKEQAAYWRHHAKQHESRAKGLSKLTGGRTAEQIRADNEELERLRTGQLSAQEKAVKEAEGKARAEEREKAGQRIAKATFEGALGHLEKKDRDEILSGLDFKKYIDEDGEVDTDKVRAYAAKIAPVDKTTTRTKRDFGGGHRPEGTGKHSAFKTTESGEAPKRTWGK